MRTIGDVHDEVREAFRDDADRVLSEHGLTMAEVQAQVDRVFEIGDASEGIAVAIPLGDFRALLERVFAEGIVTGVRWRRDR